jgi:hypothetical protein
MLAEAEYGMGAEAADTAYTVADPFETITT